jgi:hypothetical protein
MLVINRIPELEMATEKLVFNIDSRFRNNPETSSSSDFTIDIPTPIRNVKSIKLVSEEIPNVFYAFESDTNTILQVRPGPDPDSSGVYTHKEWETIIIEPGNYDAQTFVTLIRDDIGRALGFPQSPGVAENQRGFGFTVSTTTGQSILTLNKSSFEYAILDGSGGIAPDTFEINLSPVDLNQVYEYALADGAFSGISDEDKYITEIDIYAQAIQHHIINLDIGEITLNEIMGFSDILLYGKDTYSGTTLINTRGFNYVLLDVNGYDTLTHISKDNEKKIFAKIPFKVTKFFTSISNVGATTYPKLFDQPETIRKFKVRILDIFGNVINLRNVNVNLMFEVEYYRTQKGYDKARTQLIPDGNVTKFSSPGSRTSEQARRKERLRNIVFKS